MGEHLQQKSVNQEKFLITFGFLYFAISDLGRMLAGVGIPQELTYIVYFIIYGIFIFRNIRRITALDLLYYIVISVVVITGLANYSNFIDSRTRVLSVLLIFYPGYLFFRLFDYKYIERCVIAAGWFSAVYLLLYYFFVVMRSSEYSMSYAYWISFPICVFAYKFVKEKKVFYLFATLLMLGTLIMAGCRGALFLTIVCILYYYASENLTGQFDTKKIALILLTLLLILVAYLNMDFIIELLEKYGGNSRNVQKLLQGNYFDTTSRNGLYDTCKRLIDENIWGYGPLASRKLIREFPYPHSIFYELQLDYGKYIGLIIFTVIILFMIIDLWRYRRSPIKIVAGYIVIVGVGSLFVSGSYFHEYYIPALFALFIQSKQQINQEMNGNNMKKHTLNEEREKKSKNE